MCGTCGCAMPHAPRPRRVASRRSRPRRAKAVAVLGRLLDANDREAAHNREHLDDHGVLAINLSSPGSGKTRLLSRQRSTRSPAACAWP